MNKSAEQAETHRDLRRFRPLELHYFRVPRHRWELALMRLRQLGADAVSTPLPWAWHQLSAKVYDFSGSTHPGRDVVGFVTLCAALDLPVLLRLGPYVGDGLLAGGIPMWLLRDHPEVHALAANQQPLRDRLSGCPLPCAEHPIYLSYVEAWFRQATQVLADLQQPAGPIFAVQASGPTRYELAPSPPPAVSVPLPAPPLRAAAL
jgi:beta-galactosidase